MLKFFVNDLRRNLTKLLCLTIGLAIGLLLVAKAYIEQSYNSFIPENGNVYIITESIIAHGEFMEYQQTPGAIAPGLKRYAPPVESATRFTQITGELTVKTPDGQLFDAAALILADTCAFDVLRQPVVSGNPKEALAVENHCMIPRSLAEKIGGDVIGTTLSSPELNDSYSVIIDGIYEDFPVNSTFTNAIYLSMPSIGNFMGDGTENWVGNDRYKSYVRLVDGATADDVRPYIDRMIRKELPPEAIEVFHMNFGLMPMTDVYTAQESVTTMIWVLSILAFIILVSASLNYLLIVIGQFGRRSREMAVRKCYGTGNTAIFGRIMGESLFFLAVAIVLAVLIVLCLSDQCEMLLGYSVYDLLSGGRVWLVEGCVILGLFVITGVVPAWMYCKTPVSNVFRHNPRRRRVWKLALLSVQFFAAGLLFCLLVLVFRQYRMMSHGDMGYDSENIASVYLGTMPDNERGAMVAELSSLGCVDAVTSADQDFTYGAAGNNVWIHDDPRKDNQVNVADMYWANANLFDVMGMEFVQGGTFRENADTTVNQVIVEERFIDIMKTHFGAKDDNIVGKRFCITEHSGDGGSIEFTICGVIKDIRRGGYNNDYADPRAGVLFPATSVRQNVYVRFGELTPEALAEAQRVVDKFGNNKYLVPYKTRVEVLSAPVKRFGFSVMAAGVAILLIAIVGLIGYTADEVQRRAREIAIRKVNGTTVGQILRLFCRDIMRVAAPSLLCGGIAAVIIGRNWLSQFTEQVSLSPLTMTGCLLILLALIVAVVALNARRVARSNPVDYLRAE